MKQETLPFVLRTACLRLMLFLHVDADPWEETRLPRTSRLLVDYSGPSADAAASMRRKRSLAGDKGRIADLRDVLVKYLQVSRQAGQAPARLSRRKCPTSSAVSRGAISQRDLFPELQSPLVQLKLGIQVLNWLEFS